MKDGEHILLRHRKYFSGYEHVPYSFVFSESGRRRTDVSVENTCGVLNMSAWD